MGCDVVSEIFCGNESDLKNYQVYCGLDPYYIMYGAKIISHHPITKQPFNEVEWKCPNIEYCQGCGFDHRDICPHELAMSMVGKWNYPRAIPIYDIKTGERKFFVLGISYPN